MPSSVFFSIFPSIRGFPNELAVCIRWPKYWSFSFSISQSFQQVFRPDFPQDWLVWSPCCPRDSQKPSPAPQFESIKSLAFCFLYGPVLTTVCDHWEDHSLDYTDLCQQSDVSAFQHTIVNALLPSSHFLIKDLMKEIGNYYPHLTSEKAKRPYSSTLHSPNWKTAGSDSWLEIWYSSCCNKLPPKHCRSESSDLPRISLQMCKPGGL